MFNLSRLLFKESITKKSVWIIIGVSSILLGTIAITLGALVANGTTFKNGHYINPIFSLSTDILVGLGGVFISVIAVICFSKNFYETEEEGLDLLLCSKPISGLKITLAKIFVSLIIIFASALLVSITSFGVLTLSMNIGDSSAVMKAILFGWISYSIIGVFIIGFQLLLSLGLKKVFTSIASVFVMVALFFINILLVSTAGRSEAKQFVVSSYIDSNNNIQNGDYYELKAGQENSRYKWIDEYKMDSVSKISPIGFFSDLITRGITSNNTHAAIKIYEKVDGNSSNFSTISFNTFTKTLGTSEKTIDESKQVQFMFKLQNKADFNILKNEAHTLALEFVKGKLNQSYSDEAQALKDPFSYKSIEKLIVADIYNKLKSPSIPFESSEFMTGPEVIGKIFKYVFDQRNELSASLQNNKLLKGYVDSSATSSLMRSELSNLFAFYTLRKIINEGTTTILPAIKDSLTRLDPSATPITDAQALFTMKLLYSINDSSTSDNIGRGSQGVIYRLDDMAIGKSIIKETGDNDVSKNVFIFLGIGLIMMTAGIFIYSRKDYR